MQSLLGFEKRTQWASGEFWLSATIYCDLITSATLETALLHYHKGTVCVHFLLGPSIPRARRARRSEPILILTFWEFSLSEVEGVFEHVSLATMSISKWRAFISEKKTKTRAAAPPSPQLAASSSPASHDDFVSQVSCTCWAPSFLSTNFWSRPSLFVSCSVNNKKRPSNDDSEFMPVTKRMNQLSIDNSRYGSINHLTSSVLV